MACRVKMEYLVVMGRLECQEETVSIELLFLFFFLTKSELKELGSLSRALQTRDGIIIISLRFVLLLQ